LKPANLETGLSAPSAIIMNFASISSSEFANFKIPFSIDFTSEFCKSSAPNS
jgi:hypothetical protein